jgi:hypothetical protein
LSAGGSTTIAGSARPVLMWRGAGEGDATPNAGSARPVSMLRDVGGSVLPTVVQPAIATIAKRPKVYRTFIPISVLGMAAARTPKLADLHTCKKVLMEC